MARTDRQLVAAAFRGQLTKPARELSDSYIARLAREVRAARAEGRRPDRQAGRGHRPRVVGGVRITTEHPKEFVRRDGKLVSPAKARPAGVRGGPTDRHTVGHATIVQREFRSSFAAWRYLHSLPGSTPVQAVARGELVPSYTTGALELDEADENGEPKREWRVFYTGTAEGATDENGVLVRTYAEWADAIRRVFVVGTVDRFIVRRQG